MVLGKGYTNIGWVGLGYNFFLLMVGLGYSALPKL